MSLFRKSKTKLELETKVAEQEEQLLYWKEQLVLTCINSR